MRKISWLRDKDNIKLVSTFLIGALTALVGWLTWIEQRKASISQPAIVESYSSYHSRLNFLDGGNTSIIAICRTELYVSNRGGTDSLIKILQTTYVPDFYPNLNPPELNLVSTIQHHLDISAFRVSDVPMLAAFHNWGKRAPALNNVFHFYQTNGLEILNQNDDLSETPDHLAYLGSPLLYGERTSTTQTITAPPSATTTFNSQKSDYPFLQQHSEPVIVGGQKLEKLVIDHLVMYDVKADQTPMLSSVQMPIPIKIKAFFIDRGVSSHTSLCSPPGQFPVF